MSFRTAYLLLISLFASISIHAQNIDSLRAEARKQMLGGHYSDAVDIYTIILHLIPGDTAALDRRALAYVELEQYKKAFADFANVLDRYPTNERALFWRARAYSEQERYTEAIADLSMLIAAHTSLFDSTAYNNRGLYKQEAGDFSGAIKDFEVAISLAPTNALYYMNLGDVLCDAGRSAEGLTAMGKALDMAPGDADYHVARAKHLVKEGNDSAAIADYNAAFDLESDGLKQIAHILHQRAESKYRVGDYQGAIRDLNMVASTYGKYKELFYWRGLSYVAIGNIPAGCNDLSIARDQGEKRAKQEMKKHCR